MLAVAVACVVLTVAIAPMSSTNTAGASEAVLRIGFPGTIDSLSPYLGLNAESYFFYSLVYDCLHSVDEDMNPVSNLATSSYVVPATDQMMVETGEPFGSVWQYNITRNASWSDGVPFTAEDVVWNINLNAHNFEDLWAFQPYGYFMEFAERVDDYTVRIHFYDRDTGASIPAAFGYHIPIPMLPRHKFQEANLDAGDIGFGWTGLFKDEKVPVVATGPYMVTSKIEEEWLGREKITLVRNPDYHQQSDKGISAHFDKVILRLRLNSTAMESALMADLIDLARLTPDAYGSLSAQQEPDTLGNVMPVEAPMCDGDSIVVTFSIGGTWYGMNPNQMIRDPAVRTALARAIDKQQIIDEVLDGHAQEGSTVISSVSPWHCEPSPEEEWAYSPEAAAQVLEDAGYIDSDQDGIREATAGSYSVLSGFAEVGDKLELVMGIRARNTPEHLIAQMVAAQWAEVGVPIVRYEESIYGALCPWGPFDVGIAHRPMDVDPVRTLFQNSYRGWGGWADSRWMNSSFEDSFNMSIKTLDAGLRHQHVDECQRVHYANAPQIVLAYPNCMYAFRTDRYDASAWGDWCAHPGLGLDNTWGAHPLLFRDFVEPDDDSWTLVHWGIVALATGLIVATVGIVLYLRQKKPRQPAA